MASKIKRGALVVLEGCDRAGKTTQCKRLVAALTDAGLAAKEMHFPGKKLCLVFFILIALQILQTGQRFSDSRSTAI